MVPYDALFGLAFSQAINSFRVSAGKLFLAAHYVGRFNQQRYRFKVLHDVVVESENAAVHDLRAYVSRDEGVAVWR